MNIRDNPPKYRFEEGKSFPNAEKLYADFKKRNDYLKRLREAMRSFLFHKRKFQINTSDVKTQEEFRQKVIDMDTEIENQFTPEDSEENKIEKITRLASEWGIILDRENSSREAFCSYIYHDSEWSGVKIDNSFLVTDGR